jgi:hypothetical protein
MRANRMFEIIAGLVLLLVGLAALSGSGGGSFMAILVLVGLYMLVRQFEGGRMPWEGTSRAAPPRHDDLDDLGEYEYEDHAGRERIYAHALRAVEEAGLDPETSRVLATDIGLMVYKDDRDPMVYRTRDIEDDIDYVQPFVQLRLPTKAVGLIRFEITDSDGQLLFVHEERHQLERGRNLITPAARLPIHDAQVMHDDWELRVSADGMLLATHYFGWQESATRTIRRHLSEDGEISTELKATMAENRLARLSLDDLLADQEDDRSDSQQQRQQRR